MRKRMVYTFAVALLFGWIPFVVPAAASGCNHFTYRDMTYDVILVGKQRSGGYFYAVVENVGPTTQKVAAQAECHSESSFVTLRRGQTHTFKVRVGSGNPLVRIWQWGSPYDLPAGTYPSNKGAFTLPTDSHPRAHFTSVNTTGHRAVLNSVMAKRGANINNGSWTAAPDDTKPGGTARLSRRIPTTVRHVRVEWAWNGGHKIVLDAPMVRLKG